MLYHLIVMAYVSADQVMASGMTTSTAKKGRECDGFIRDEPGLRTHPECDMVLDPNFGLIQVRFKYHRELERWNAG